jgi:hypothetical protein
MSEPLTTRELLLALYLIDYHRHAFSVRSRSLMTGTFDPPEVRELVNLVQWCGGGMKPAAKLSHSHGLHGIIVNNAKELEGLISRVRDGNRSTQLYEKINQLNLELDAVDALMEFLSNA